MTALLYPFPPFINMFNLGAPRRAVNASCSSEHDLEELDKRRSNHCESVTAEAKEHSDAQIAMNADLWKHEVLSIGGAGNGRRTFPEGEMPGKAQSFSGMRYF